MCLLTREGKGKINSNIKIVSFSVGVGLLGLIVCSNSQPSTLSLWSKQNIKPCSFNADYERTKAVISPVYFACSELVPNFKGFPCLA